MTRMMLVGPVGAGKTTLARGLEGCAAPAQAPKTQVLEFTDGIIDTPGEYLEHGRLNHALLLASHEADLVLLVDAASDREARIPPGFATMFTCPVIGVVTKTDRADPSDVMAARARLEAAAAPRVLTVSALTGEGMDALRALLSSHDRAEQGQVA